MSGQCSHAIQRSKKTMAIQRSKKNMAIQRSKKPTWQYKEVKKHGNTKK